MELWKLNVCGRFGRNNSAELNPVCESGQLSTKGGAHDLLILRPNLRPNAQTQDRRHGRLGAGR